MKKETTTFTFRVDADLKKAFEEVTEKQDQTASQMLRWFMRSHVAQYSQQDMFAPKKKGK